MAQFRTTADIIDLALINGGEVTNGNSPYESQLLSYLNRVHFTLVAGGTIPLGKDKTITIDEVWPWARAKRPIIIELQPKYETGTVTLTLGSEAGTFSSAPSYSVAGWYLKVSGRDEWFRIASHTAASTAFELDAAYTDTTGSGLSFFVAKLDYDLVPDYLVIDSENNKYEFKAASGGATNTATFTAGTYTPAQLATHAGTQITTAAGVGTVTVAYDSVTRLFTVTNNGAGGTTHIPQFASGSNAAISSHRILGFDDNDIAASNSHVSTYVVGGIARLIEPFKVSRDSSEINGVDPESFMRNYPLRDTIEGTPNRFCVIREKPDGTQTVRFNSYPRSKTRIEVDYIPIPRDLKDNASSIPVVPRKWVDVLEDACTFYLMLNKNDDRMQIYANLVQGKIEAMVAQFRGGLARMGQNFGRIVPRRDLVSRLKRRFSDGEPY